MSDLPATEPTATPSATEIPPVRGLFVSWAKLRRADTIARHLGIPSHTVRYLYRGYRGTSAPLTVWKYLLQSLHTLYLCVRHRPRVVLVTSPPLFAVLPVLLYSKVFRARLVIDTHSGCFIQEHWRRWDRWQRFLARRAALSLVHNEDNARRIEEWGAAYAVLPSLPPELVVEPSAAARAPGGAARPRCVYICSFKEDEPVESVLEAARGLPQVSFEVTGRAPAGIEDRLPGNVRLTGFLGEDEYNALLARADVILALTTRPGTLLYGAQEAIALHKPLVLSDTSTLRETFAGGPLFARNEPAALRAAVEEALARGGELAGAMAALHERSLAQGRARLAAIVRRLG